MKHKKAKREAAQREGLPDSKRLLTEKDFIKLSKQELLWMARERGIYVIGCKTREELIGKMLRKRRWSVQS